MDGAATELRYSVLISVYCKEKAEYLSAAINSIWYQTVPTDDFVLVCDGPLSPELDAVVEENAQKQFRKNHNHHQIHSGVNRICKR